MKPFLFILALATALHAEAPTRLDRPKTDYGYASVHYPPDFDQTRPYHVLYWFHGTGGKPNPGIGRVHGTYISVGMSYLKRENVPSGEYGAPHWAECVAARRMLEESGLKLRRDVVAGMSKGGWAGFYIGAEVPEGPDAIAIFAAGKDWRTGDAPAMPKTLSVLVGTGETDPNYPQAQLAFQFFKQGGATVTYEEWLGKGHTYMASPRVIDWLEIESLKDRPAELHAYATRTLQEGLARCSSLLDSREKYLALRFLATHPATSHAPLFLREQLLAAGRAAAAAPDLKTWLETHSELRALVSREADFLDARSFDVPKLQQLVNRFRGLTESASDPGLAARAAYGTRRAQKMFAIYSAQQKAWETPEYVALNARYLALQLAYTQADGKPGDAVMAELKEVGVKLSDLRFNATMSAFRDAEWARKPEPDPVLDAAVKADPAGTLRAYLGVGF